MTDRNDRPFDFLHASLVEKCEAIAKLTPEQREIVKIAALAEIAGELTHLEMIDKTIERRLMSIDINMAG